MVRFPLNQPPCDSRAAACKVAASSLRVESVLKKVAVPPSPPGVGVGAVGEGASDRRAVSCVVY